MKYIGIILFLIHIHMDVMALGGKYPIKNYKPSEYRAGIQNIDFVQNRDMTLFVANNLGVLSYNGNEWTTHISKSGKKQRSLAYDEKTSRLYVGSQGEFGFFNLDWHYESLIDKIPVSHRNFDEVWDTYIIDDRVYFCTFQGIFAYDGESISFINTGGGLNRSFEVNGQLFTQNRKGQLYEVKKDKMTPMSSENNKNNVIVGIIAQSEGYLLFYNSGRIESFGFFGDTDKYNNLIQTLNDKYINHVLQLSDTRLAISTQTSGLFLFDLQNQSVENISVEGGLQSNACLRAFEDFSGNLWIGMQNGIAMIDINSPMRLIDQEKNIQGSGYEAYEVNTGYYFTTSNGIYYLPHDASHSIFLNGTEGPAYGVTEISGKIYAGHHTGLFLLENGKAERIAETDGLWQIKQLRSNPAYAIAGTYSGLFLFKIDDKNRLQAVNKIEGFNETSRFFEEDVEGRIWVGQFYKGLYRLELNEELLKAEVINISDKNDLPIEEQIVLSRIDNELYLATSQGVYFIDQNTSEISKAEMFSEVIGEQPVYLIVQDNKKNIHVFAKNIVGFYKKISAENYVFVPSSLFQLRYNFNNDLLNVSINCTDGIFYNANEGFIHYEPELEDHVAVDKPLVISRIYSVTEDSILYSLRVFGKRPIDTPKLEISSKTKVLKIEVESFQFDEMNTQQFRYFLKGFDDNYGEWSNIASKEYTSLREGDYEFYAQTLNYLGEVVTSQPIRLEVSPPFHRSNLAKGLYILLGLLPIYFINRYQKLKYKRKSIKMEEAKQHELEENQRRLVEIKNLKEKELLQIKEEKMENELRHLNKMLGASTMNLVVKNEFMESLKESLKEVNRNGNKTATKNALEKIIRGIDTTLRLHDDWEQFEHHFDQVHGNFSSRIRTEFVDLSPNDHKLCAFLRLNLNTKEISNLMGISHRGVEVARYRLRKKLNLKTGENLSKFVLEY